MRELSGIPALRAALEDARDYTLQLYAHLTPAQRRFPYRRTVNPPAWELAHVGWFQEFWCLRFRERDQPLAARLPGADVLLNSSIIPHADRWERPMLTWERALGYLHREFQDTLAALERSSADQRYFFQLALLHEDMHGEAFLMSLQSLALPEPERRTRPVPAIPKALNDETDKEVEFAGGELVMGSPPARDFAFDNEKPEHLVNVAPFALARTAVSNAQYAQFVDAGGYAASHFWTAEGWQWRLGTGLGAPGHWRRDGAQWLVRRFDQWEPLPPDDPVIHVSAFEAEAYCSFAGKRLPTEAEWEYAARSGRAPGEDRYPWGCAAPACGAVNLDGVYRRPVPVGALAEADTPAGLHQMIGNVWEWTGTEFQGYPGFRPDPYLEYSQPWFSGHRVLRGGCFATRARLVHSRFRNFYTPDRNDVFAGLRTARTLGGAQAAWSDRVTSRV